MKRVITGALLVVLGYGSSLSAQPAPTPEEVQQAQARWGEGKAAFDAGNYESARVAFKQAFTLFQHPAFLQNLGEAELHCGRPVEAARHLSQFIRSAPSATPAQREAAKRSLKKASEKLGSLTVETNTDDAEVRVDDEPIGRSPLGSMQWYVQPGTHAVSARKEGYLDGNEQVEVAIGAPKSVFIKLQRVVGGAPEEPRADASTKDADSSMSAAPAADASPAGAKSSFEIEPRTAVLIGGAVLSVAAGGLAIYYHTKAVDDVSARNAVRDQFAPFGGIQTNTCVKPTSATGPLCQSLAGAESQIQKDLDYRLAFGVTSGVAAAATVAAFFLWPAKTQHSVALTFDVGPDRSAIWLDGRF
jgi:hypothetical protein